MVMVQPPSKKSSRFLKNIFCNQFAILLKPGPALALIILQINCNKMFSRIVTTFSIGIVMVRAKVKVNVNMNVNVMYCNVM